MSRPHIAILGAGPVGLEAAVAAVEEGLPFTVYESASEVAGNVRSWGHVRLFTPWSMNVSPRMRRILAGADVEPPDDDSYCPTGRELTEQLYRRVGAVPEVEHRLRLATHVVEIGRDGLLKSDEIGTGQRARKPFRLLVRGADGSERLERADVVLDCTGTYHNPNALGAGGIRAPGERLVEDRIIRRIPDFEVPSFEGDAPGWGGRRILLVGAGHSAQTAARDLQGLLERVPETEVIWAVRSQQPTFGAVPDDPLPARDALVRRAQELVSPDSPFDVRLGRSVERLEPSHGGIVVTLVTGDGSTETVTVDRIISLTGSVGDARMYRQLQVHECYATSGPMKLAAALLSSAGGDCLAQESQGVEALENPEPDFYILGSKSYGRNNTFLLRVGWEQVDEVFSRLAPAAAAEVRSASPISPETP
ncbi:MAG: hypothetical protein R3253_07080 [Longimicrobiales bacterium]|nr:hypothetical protein [Longimicrobiales bacterium]